MQKKEESQIYGEISKILKVPKEEITLALDSSLPVNSIEENVYSSDKDGNELATIDGGYLDIGIQDTMEDLFVNLIGAVTFSILGYCYILNKKKYKFIRKFIPMKTADYNTATKVYKKKQENKKNNT